MDAIRNNRRQRRNRGIALAEAAIVLVLLVMLTLGTIKYGWLFVKLHQTTNAAREGVRRAILPGATLSEVSTAVGMVMTAARITDYQVLVIPSVTAPAGSEITVRITVPTTGAEGVDLFPGYLPTPANLTGSVTMAKEG